MFAVDDAGNLINPIIVEGQIHGAWLRPRSGDDRRSVLDEHDIAHGSFMDYAIPRAIAFRVSSSRPP